MKYLHHDYLVGSDPLAASDPVFANGTSKGAAAFDLGLRAGVVADLARVDDREREAGRGDDGVDGLRCRCSDDRLDVQVGWSVAVHARAAGGRATSR